MVERQGGHGRWLVRRSDAVAGSHRTAAAPSGHRAALQLVGLPPGLDVPKRRIRPVVCDELEFENTGTGHAVTAVRGGRSAEGSGAARARRVRPEGREKLLGDWLWQLPLIEFMAFRRHGNLAAYYDE